MKSLLKAVKGARKDLGKARKLARSLKKPEIPKKFYIDETGKLYKSRPAGKACVEVKTNEKGFSFDSEKLNAKQLEALQKVQKGEAAFKD